MLAPGHLRNNHPQNVCKNGDYILAKRAKGVYILIFRNLGKRPSEFKCVLEELRARDRWSQGSHHICFRAYFSHYILSAACTWVRACVYVCICVRACGYV